MRKSPEKVKKLPVTGTRHDKLPSDRRVRGEREAATISPKNGRKQTRHPFKSKIQVRKRKRVGSKVYMALLKNKNTLMNRLGGMVEQAQKYEARIKSWPIKEHQLSSGQIIKVRQIADPIIDRMDDDLWREMNRLRCEIEQIDRLLNPTTGRPREELYDQALLDLQSDPTLTIRALAEKYYPDYFPHRAGPAIEMMRQGIGRTRRRTRKLLV